MVNKKKYYTVQQRIDKELERNKNSKTVGLTATISGLYELCEMLKIDVKKFPHRDLFDVVLMRFKTFMKVKR